VDQLYITCADTSRYHLAHTIEMYSVYCVGVLYMYAYITCVMYIGMSKCLCLLW